VVNEALSGLPGVDDVEPELERDQFVVNYDANRISENEILEACDKSGFPATVVANNAPSDSTDNAAGEKTASDEFSPPAFFVEALKSAKQDSKPIVLDFMAEWCAPCKRLVAETFVDPAVAALLENFILLKIDTDEYPEIAKHYDVSVLPDIRFLNSDGVEVKKLTGFQAADVFANELKPFVNKKP